VNINFSIVLNFVLRKGYIYLRTKLYFSNRFYIFKKKFLIISIIFSIFILLDFII
jgi:hypothetical protein